MKYQEILNIIKGRNVELRHDVDLSMRSALQMAMIEFDNDIKSTYYIRFNGQYYNPLTNKNKRIISSIISMGHEIGAHVESQYIKDEDDLKRELISMYSTHTFKKFTFHINNEITKKFTNTDYAGFENKNIVNSYISDSRGEWDEEKTQWIKNNDNYTLNIHPEWWMFTGTKQEIIEHAIKEILP